MREEEQVNRFTTSVLVVFYFLCSSVLSAANAPAWLKELAQKPISSCDLDTNPSAVVLLDEMVTAIDESGVETTRVRYAVKVLENDGKKHAKMYARYENPHSKISKFGAWSIDAKGKAYTFKKSEFEDHPISGYLVYSKRRSKYLDAEFRMRKGVVFGYEYTTSEKSVFAQGRWRFSSENPVEVSRFELQLPEGWTVDEYSHAGAPEVRFEKGRYIWEMVNIPAVKQEPNVPSKSRGFATLLYQINSPEGEVPKHSNVAFDSWKDVVDYTLFLMDPMVKPNETIREKSLSLIDGEDTVWDKIRVIGDFVKKKDYAAISMDLSRGGGYTPRSAVDTFETGYGDCKDKATLMRSMLRCVGIESYPVIVNARTNSNVIEGWPSTNYFNHCIIAVEIDESVEAPAVLEDPEIGRFLIVDPTSSMTPVGNLPYAEQGGLVVLAKPGTDRLLSLPLETPEENQSSRTIIAEILPDGSLLGRTNDRHLGNAAQSWRVLYSKSSEKGIKKRCIRMINEGNGVPIVELISYTDDALQGHEVSFEYEFLLKQYSRSIMGNTLIFRPAIFSRVKEPRFIVKDRIHPVMLEGRLLKEEVLFYLPENYEVEEMRENISVECDYGTYSSTLEKVDNATLKYTRKLRMKSVTVRIEEYPDLVSFYEKLIHAEESPIVLTKRASEQVELSSL